MSCPASHAWTSEFAAVETAEYWKPVAEEGDVWGRDEPMKVEWRRGSTLIGDFTWNWGSYLLARRAAIEVLLSRFSGAQILPVEIVEPTEYPAARDRVPFPYQGPEIVQLWITHWADHDETWSTVWEQPETPEDPADKVLHGVESIEPDPDDIDDDIEMDWIHTKREPGKGLFVHKDQLASNDLFRFRWLPGYLMCTDNVRDLILAEGYSNILFLEMGDVFD